MKCKTSCFNPSLFKNDLRRFWPLPVCSFFLFLCSLTLPLYRYLSDETTGMLQQYYDAYPDGSALLHSVAVYLAAKYVWQVFLLAVLALVAALLLFQHLHGKKEIQFYLSLPMRRSGLYLTSLLTGLLMVLLPMVPCYGIAAGICLHFEISVLPVLQMLAACCLIFLLFYGMAILACVLAGQRFGAFLLYAGMHGAAAAIWVGLAQVVECFVPGFSASVEPPQWFVWLVPLVRLYSSNTIDAQNSFHMTTPLVYGGVGFVLLVLSGVLYQLRRAETAGDMLSFSAIKIISKIFAALAVGLGGFALLQLLAFPDQSVSFGVLMLLVLVLIAIGWIAAEMIIQKSFRIFHSRSVLIGCALLVVTAAAMLGAKADAFGYIHRIPDSDQVKSASISMQYYQVYDYIEIAPADALSLHEAALDHLDQFDLSHGGSDTVQFAISYGLKDGSTMERTYYFDENAIPDLEESILAIMDKPENVMNEIFSGWTTKPSVDTFENAWFDVSYFDGSHTPKLTRNGQSNINLSAEEAVTLYNAVCQDIQAGHVMSPTHFQFFSGSSDTDVLAYVHMCFHAYPYDASKESYTHYLDTVGTLPADFQLLSTMTRTIAAMKDMGFEFH